MGSLSFYRQSFIPLRIYFYQGKVVHPAGFEPATFGFITLQLSLPSLLMRNVRALDFPFIIPTEVGLDATRQVSTPSPFGAWHGIAILQVSPFLSGSTRRVSPTAPNL